MSESPSVAYTTDPVIVSLSDASDRSVVGAKATGLALLLDCGQTVPAGFVITVGHTNNLDSTETSAAITAGLQALGAGPVAVRSSAVEEDQQDASHAGQYASVLNVSPTVGAVTDAARKVVASAHGDPIAVIVQQMVPATTAGVAFSANPTTGDAEVVISSITGLADRLLNGSESGNEWVMKDSELTLRAGDRVDEEVIRDVATAVRDIESALGHPVDVEWAYDGEILHIVQARPITALPVQPTDPVPEGFWTKDSTHHPGPLRPLVTSGIGQGDGAVARWAKRSGLVIDRLEETTIHGELYNRPIPVGSDGSGKTPPWWLIGIISRVHPEMRRRMAAARALVESGRLDSVSRDWELHGRASAQEAIKGLRGVDLEALDDQALLEHIDAVEVFEQNGADIHFDLALAYFVSLHELVMWCEQHLNWDAATTLRLLTGHSVASSEPTIALRSVAAAIEQSPAALDALRNGAGDLQTRIAAADPNVAVLLDQWVDVYGFRSVHYDWSGPTIGELPGLVERMVLAELENPTNVLEADQIERQARNEIPVDKIDEFNRVVNAARRDYPTREDNTAWLGSTVGALMRMAWLEVGRRLADRSIIADSEDVFFLTNAEARNCLEGNDGDRFETVRRRRGERAWTFAHPGPPTYGVSGGPPPDIRGLPKAARKINGALLWAIEAEFGVPPVSEANSDAIVGLPGAAGICTGTARVITSETDFARVQSGDVIVCPITNPAWSVLFGIAGAFVCDSGGPLSHTAILAREYDIPSVLATGDATTRISDGDTITVDGTAGTVSL
ncbi:MAG: PEP-utilizing enzyme [Acidimicrobiia bacterium]|nr:PEP-utilizing enzyme [Acidimicrobiia bacterium]